MADEKVFITVEIQMKTLSHVMEAIYLFSYQYGEEKSKYSKKCVSKGSSPCSSELIFKNKCSVIRGNLSFLKILGEGIWAECRLLQSFVIQTKICVLVGMAWCIRVCSNRLRNSII